MDHTEFAVWLDKPARAKGRAGRSGFALYLGLVGAAVGCCHLGLQMRPLDTLLAGARSGRADALDIALLFALTLTVILCLYLPNAAAQRLQDAGFSGLWLVLLIVPIIGWLALLVLLLRPSEAGRNAYGPPVG